jgi:ribonuclease P protein component
MPKRLGRLLRRKDFLRVAAGRRKWVAAGLILQACDSDAPESAGARAEGRRVGFTASKKVGNAVARNRAKRRLRAAAHEVMSEAALSDTDYVVIARADTAGRPYLLLKQDLAPGLRRLKALKAGGTSDEA